MMMYSGSPGSPEFITTPPPSPRLLFEPSPPRIAPQNAGGRITGRGRPRRVISSAVESAIIPIRRRLQDFVDVQTGLENENAQMRTEIEVS
jgi:hypothetical protein